MGQAKQRRADDPSYGKPKAAMRGVILSAPAIVDIGRNRFTNNGTLDDSDLRASLFYWDRLMWPTNRMIHIESGPDARFLESAGIMSRPVIQMTGRVSGAEVAVNSVKFALMQAEAEEPGIWSIGGGANSLDIVDHRGEPLQGTSIALLNAIPLPSAKVPLPEILEFKAKRRPELLAFRAHLESMTKEISDAGDSADAMARKLKELDLACADLFRTTREWQLPFHLADLKLSMNTDFAKSIDVGTKAWGQLDGVGMGETGKLVGAALAGASTLFTIKADYKFQGIKRPASPYKYLYLAKRDLF